MFVCCVRRRTPYRLQIGYIAELVAAVGGLEDGAGVTHSPAGHRIEKVHAFERVPEFLGPAAAERGDVGEW